MMDKNSVLQLAVAAMTIGLFLVSWLVFHHIRWFDWALLVVGVLDLVVFFLDLKKK